MLYHNNYKSLTNTVTVCKHTSIKIGMSTHFTSISSLKLTPEHPIFSAPASELEDCIKRSNQLRLTTTEQYLVAVAWLVNTGLVDTSRYGLELNNQAFKESALMLLLPKLIPLIHLHHHKQLIPTDDSESGTGEAYPVYTISDDNYQDGKALREYLKLIITHLENYYTFGAIYSKSDSLDVEDILKQELLVIENGHNNRLPTSKIKKRFMQLAEPFTQDDDMHGALRKYLYTKDITTLNNSTARKIAEWVRITVVAETDQHKLIIQQAVRQLDHVVTTLEDSPKYMPFFLMDSKVTPSTKIAGSIRKSKTGSALSKLKHLLPVKYKIK